MKRNTPLTKRAKSHLRKLVLRYEMLFFFLFLAGGVFLFGHNYFFRVQASAPTPQSKISPDGLWQDTEATIAHSEQLLRQRVERYRLVTLNQDGLRPLLLHTPLELTDAAKSTQVVITLPLPNGEFARFQIEESPIMASGLAAKFPEIKTYRGQGMDDMTASVRFDWTPMGLHALILREGEAVQIVPLTRGDTAHYLSFYQKDVSAQDNQLLQCGVTESSSSINEPLPLSGKRPAITQFGGVTRTYRLAVAATRSFTNTFGGGTIAGTIAAITTVMNQVNAIYERELSVRMQLVSENDKIIYIDNNIGPYTDNEGNNASKTTLEENHSNLNQVIGIGNYDVGHLFGRVGQGAVFAGRANVGAVCSDTLKGGGCSLFSGNLLIDDPGYPFDLQTVTHELGHQFGANHSFNHSCGGNRNQGTAWEPDSGSTIMSYGYSNCDFTSAKKTPGLQPAADPYFHAGNLIEMTTFINNSATCATTTMTGNKPPIVMAGPDYTIPSGTPFTLTATGSDPDNDALLYSWEEYDTGTAAPPNTDDGTRPIFRSFKPNSSPSRVFPSLTYILNNGNIPPTTYLIGGKQFVTGETLPVTNRIMTFQATARDARAIGGAIANDSIDVTVTASAGPFIVTSPNTQVTWGTGSAQKITWNVAGTNDAPVSTTQVRILLSLDGGFTFPVVLLDKTPNDGSETVIVPNKPTETARIKVEAVGNIFFDISDTNLIIKSQPNPTVNFSEFPIGTKISTQYQNIGIIFGGSGPYITTDKGNPTSPVLSGTPEFQGNITGTFVEPGTDRPTVVQSFSFDAGYFDEIGSTRIEWFDLKGKKIGQKINSHLGIERFTLEGGNIASWKIGIVETEPAGFAIDNVSFVPIGTSILFRENDNDHKEGTWGLKKDEIPGFDHAAFQIGNVVYESHPGYPGGTYVSANGKESALLSTINGVQSKHSLATFKHDSMSAVFTPVINIEEIPINEELAHKMRDKIDSVRGATFQRINYSVDGLAATLSPIVQKGGNGSFTCVGLVEWAAEQAGHNGGQGFIRNSFESFTVPDLRVFPPKTIEVPLLSPQLLNYAMKGQQLMQDAKQWVQGLFDPVDFIVTDPLGRRLGFIQGMGRFDEIPNAFYSGNGGVEQFLILNAIPGTYTIQRVGVGAQVFSAVGSLGSSENFSGFLAQGETKVQQLIVEPKAGTGGDVDGDGDVDANDITALTRRLNRFTNGLGDPGDLNGDGLLSDADVILLTKLVNILEVNKSDLSITSNVTTNPAGSVKNLTYTILVKNNGANAAASVMMTDNLPASITYASCSATNGGVCGGSGNNRTVTFASLAAGASATVTLTANVVCSGVGSQSISNTASVSSSTPDPNPNNNSATATVTVSCQPKAELTLPGGKTAFSFGPIAPIREANTNLPNDTFTIENSGNTSLNLRFAVRRTGNNVSSGKVTTADDSSVFPLRVINADGTETLLLSDAQVDVPAGQKRNFRVLFNPLIPNPAGRTNNLFANQVIPDLINSTLTITPNFGNAFIVPLSGRVTTNARLINPLAPRLAPLIVLVKSGDEYTVEFSAHDANNDAYAANYQFLDSNNRPVGIAQGADLDLSQLVKGQSFTIVKKFTGASRTPSVTKVQVTLYDREGNESFVSAPIGTAIGRVVNVSGASFKQEAIATESIISAFGTGMANAALEAKTLPLPTELAGTRVYVRDSANVERPAPLFFSSPLQINYLIPEGTAPGAANIVVAKDGAVVATETTQVSMTAPAIFTASSNGLGVAAALVQRVRGDGSQVYEQVARYDLAQSKFVAVPIEMGPANDQVFLVLFGTGIRYRTSLDAVKAKIGGVDVEVLYAGAQGGYVGLDQVNLRVPRHLLGSGEVDVVLTVDGKVANTVRVHIR